MNEEDEKERRDRQLIELLNELRVAKLYASLVYFLKHL
jgi:hypothetical protein